MLFNLTLVDRSGKAAESVTTVSSAIVGTGVGKVGDGSGGVLPGIGGRGG